MDNNNNENLFPLPPCPPVSDEAFNTFHTIDRELYTRLITNLGRDPAESMQVMALWMWLERTGHESSLIKRMLTLPLSLLSRLADEAITCLQCVENDVFVYGNNEITLLPELVGVRRDGTGVSLRFFHDNRIAVIRGVSKIITTVCARAFNDILIRVRHGKDVAVPVPAPPVHHEIGESSRDAEMRNVVVGGTGEGVVHVPMMYHHPYVNVPFVPVAPGNVSGLISLPQVPPQVPQQVMQPIGLMGEAIGIPMHMLNLAAYDFEMQRHLMSSHELGEMLSRNLSLGNNNNNFLDDGKLKKKFNEGGDDMPPDDRTIFLTFSKGYPICEDEVHYFFTRRFGDFIEEIIMQDVAEDEQVLYARMVVARRSIGVIDAIVGEGKEKYSINGKHVWARKYVKKPHNSARSPPRGGGSPPSDPNPN